VQFLRNVQSERQTREHVRTDDAKCLSEWNRRQPFGFGFIGFGVSQIDSDAGPCSTTVGDGKLEMDRSILEDERLAFAPK
jgi:hypothetical protein